MKTELNGKVIVITGASHGIGRELAEMMADNGANVVINYNKSVDEAEEVLCRISKTNFGCTLVRADVTDENQVRDFYRQVMKRYGKVDVLINNAGKCKDSLFTIMSQNTWKNVLDTNLSSAFYCSKHFSKAMIKQNSGKIFNIASYKGQEGCSGQANYSASKAGLIGLTKTMAKELSHFGICVNAVCPGFIVTSLNKASGNKINMAKEQSLLPIEKNLSALINTLTFMASDNFENVSGQVFNIDSRVI